MKVIKVPLEAPPPTWTIEGLSEDCMYALRAVLGHIDVDSHPDMTWLRSMMDTSGFTYGGATGRFVVEFAPRSITVRSKQQCSK